LVLCQVIDLEEKSKTMDETHFKLYMFSDSHMKLYYVESIGYVIVLWTVKATFVALYYALLHQMSRIMRYALYFLTFLVMATFGVNFALYVGWCQPLEQNWMDRSPHCTPATVNRQIVTALFVSNVVTHILVTGFPIIIVRSYRMTCKERAGLIFMGCCCLASLSITTLRYVVMHKLMFSVAQRPAYVRYQQLLGVIELIAVNLAFCFPAFRPCFPQIHLWWISRKRRRRSNDDFQREALKSGKDSRIEEVVRPHHLEINVTRELVIDEQRQSVDSTHAALFALGLLGLTVGPGYRVEAKANDPGLLAKEEVLRMDTFSSHG